MPRQTIELTAAIPSGMEIPVYKGKPIGRKKQDSRIGLKLFRECVEPCVVSVSCFSYSSDKENGIYSGEVSQREVKFTGMYCKRI